MCGIAGIIGLTNNFRPNEAEIKSAIQTLGRRGPDDSGIFIHAHCTIGQTRLSILDTSERGHQPMSDPSGRFTLVFNGEIYNFKELKKGISGVNWQSETDTEVLLHLLLKEGTSCLTKLNGFFAFAFFDKKEQSLILARDRMGIKPLHYYLDSEKLAFASEMKALMQFPFPRKINPEALQWYVQLNYLPGELSMLEGVKKLNPGHFLKIKNGIVETGSFFQLERPEPFAGTYDAAQQEFITLFEASVQRRLIADVPLGAFLSGGTDSSAVVAMASRHQKHFSTFSIGFPDEPFFDETYYAQLVAKKFNTEHTVFNVRSDDMLHDLPDILDYIDEPFADSSAIPTYLLSRHVSTKVKVALSGDGADELFGGYYKHLAMSNSLEAPFTNFSIKAIHPLTKLLPSSRSGKFSNLVRRINRYGEMLKLSKQERYWYLASMTYESNKFLKSKGTNPLSFNKSKFLSANPDMNEFLDADLKIVLPGDMLTKVDLMSMAHGLEVRVPFLDKEVVQFARSLPAHFKVNQQGRKRIVRDAFRKILPEGLYSRPKKGFEVPLLSWLRNELSSELDDVLFNSTMLDEQGLFHTQAVMQLRNKLHSNNPGDVHGTIWALYVFQKWYKNYFI
jgi:asparagine synthase (glutamine-hydrolysing)